MSRKWRTSYQVPFAAMMTWEKFTCTSSFSGPQVRLLLNEAPVALSFCKHADKKLGEVKVENALGSMRYAHQR